MRTIFLALLTILSVNLANGEVTLETIHDGMRFKMVYDEEDDWYEFVTLAGITDHDRSGILTIPDSVYFAEVGVRQLVTKVDNKVLWDLPNVTEIYFPASLYSFHLESAPKNCPNLEKIHLGKKFNSFTSQNILYGLPKLKEIDIEEGNTFFKVIDGVVYSADLATLYVAPPALEQTEIEVPEGCTHLVMSAFENCKSIKSVKLPATVVSIQQNCFAGCENLESFEMPSSVTFWGNNMFQNDKGLLTAQINDAVDNIPVNAFINCTSLKTVVIGKNVQKIYNNAFNPCWKLETLTVKAEIPPTFTGTQWFYEPVYETCELIVPAGCGEAYRNAEVWKNFRKITDPSEPTRSDAAISAEYFIDRDPGVGKATGLDAATGENLYTLPLEGVAPGSHIFGIRVVDDASRWTPTVTRPLYIADEMLYADMEYYVDEDPGEGKGKGVAHGHSRMVHFNVSTDNISVGTHTLSVRLLDPEGKWGEVMTRPFVVVEKAPETDLLLEYFYDVDPGVGAAKKVAVGEGENVFYLPLEENLQPGAHIFGVRCMDKEGRWSATTVNPLYLVDRIRMASAEYYVDNDPGEGNGNAVAIGEDGNSAFVIPTATLSSGQHQLVMRGKDEDGRWFTLFSRPFEVTSGSTGIDNIEWKLGFTCQKTPSGIMLESDEIPDGSHVTVVSLQGHVLAKGNWADTTSPLYLDFDYSGIIVLRIVTPDNEVSVKTVDNR